MRSSLRLPSVIVLALAAAALPAGEVAINAQVFNGYAREQLPDGSFKPEFYSFGEGGCWSRALDDPWMERLDFMDIARVVAGPLAKANYRPALKSADAQLLIIVYWGSTQGSNDLDRSQSVDRATTAIAGYDRAQDPAEKSKSRGLDRKAVDARTPEGAAYETMLWQLGVNNRLRDELDERNARILGYSEALERARFARNTSLGDDILQELGSNRYYVVLQAYDFKTAAREKKLRPLWTARLSVVDEGAFADALNRMAWTASHHFGRATDGLKRERLVSVGLPPVKFLEALPAEGK
jgi:hypothetical protein